MLFALCFLQVYGLSSYLRFCSTDKESFAVTFCATLAILPFTSTFPARIKSLAFDLEGANLLRTKYLFKHIKVITESWEKGNESKQ